MSPFRNIVRLAATLALALVATSVLAPAVTAQEAMRTSPYTRSPFTEPRLENGVLQLSLEVPVSTSYPGLPSVFQGYPRLHGTLSTCYSAVCRPPEREQTCMP